jgi:hypothetical protein
MDVVENYNASKNFNVFFGKILANKFILLYHRSAPLPSLLSGA